MPDFGSLTEFEGWEPGSAEEDRWSGVTKFMADGSIEWVREVAIPKHDPADDLVPYTCGGGVGYDGGVIFGVHIDKFLWLYRYTDKGEQVEKVEIHKQMFSRAHFSGNDIIIDKNGRLWMLSYPTQAGLENNLAQVLHMPVFTNV